MSYVPWATHHDWSYTKSLHHLKGELSDSSTLPAVIYCPFLKFSARVIHRHFDGFSYTQIGVRLKSPLQLKTWALPAKIFSSVLWCELCIFNKPSKWLWRCSSTDYTLDKHWRQQSGSWVYNKECGENYRDRKAMCTPWSFWQMQGKLSVRRAS